MNPADPTVEALLLLARVPPTAHAAAPREAASHQAAPREAGPPGSGPRVDAVRRLLRQGVDLSRLRELAVRGGVGGAVAAGLERAGRQLVPAEHLRAFTAARLFAEAMNRRLLTEARRLMLAAQDEQLVLVPVKGIALLMDRPYRDLTVRTLVDIDFLVARPDYARVERLLVSQGYQPESRREHALRHEHHVVFRRPGPTASSPAMFVELHWTPFYTLYGSPPADADLFSRLVPHDHQGARFELLDLEDTLLVLLSHLAHHRFRGQLKWAVDVIALIDELGDQIDWKLFWSRAGSLGAVRGAAYGLWLVEQLFGPVAHSAQTPELPWPVQRALRRLNAPQALVRGDRQPPIWQRTITDVLLQDRLRHGLRYLLYKVPELLERELSARLPDRLVRGGPDSAR